MAKQLSSSLTLFWVIAAPTIWLSFFAVFSLAIFLSGYTHFGSIPALYLKIGLPLFFLLGLVYLKFNRLKRIDIDQEYLYATNYIKTYKYPWQNIEKISPASGFILKKGKIHLKTPGQFGKKIPFLVSSKRWAEMLEGNLYGIADFVK